MTSRPAPEMLRQRLAERLRDTGSLHDPRLRRAVETVPREIFLGPAIYRPSEPPAPPPGPPCTATACPPGSG
ncbi:hypothetical protein [Streptomyces sp. G45]|uniref:hypothetical protein n=1 Tax=Streptomyces sp. G45 TaxID=3406627 RepID=UPI003C183956